MEAELHTRNRGVTYFIRPFRQFLQIEPADRRDLQLDVRLKHRIERRSGFSHPRIDYFLQGVQLEFRWRDHLSPFPAPRACSMAASNTSLTGGLEIKPRLPR